MTPKAIRANFSGKCRSCGASHEQGDVVYWAKGVRGVLCPSCHRGTKGGAAPSAPAPSSPPPSLAPKPASKYPFTRGAEPKGPASGHGRHFRYYDTLAAFLDAATAPWPEGVEEEWADSRSDSARDIEWAGGSWARVLDYANNGWAEGLRRIGEASGEVPALGSVRNVLETVYDVAGDEVDVGRFLEGEPECMRSSTISYDKGVGPVIVLAIQGAMAGSAQPEEMFARGAAVLKAVDLLEASGRRVEVYSVMASAPPGTGGTGPNVLCYTVRLKAADQPIDKERLAFALCNAGMFRRLGFSIREHEPRAIRVLWDAGVTCGGRYGAATPTIPDGAVVADYVLNRDDDPTEWLRRILQREGEVAA